MLNNLASIALDQNRYEDAEAYYREAATISKEMLGDKHPEYAIDIVDLGRALSLQGKSDEARELLLEALRVFEAALPPDHVYIQETREQLNALP